MKYWWPLPDFFRYVKMYILYMCTENFKSITTSKCMHWPFSCHSRPNSRQNSSANILSPRVIRKKSWIREQDANYPHKTCNILKLGDHLESASFRNILIKFVIPQYPVLAMWNWKRWSVCNSVKLQGKMAKIWPSWIWEFL